MVDTPHIFQLKLSLALNLLFCICCLLVLVRQMNQLLTVLHRIQEETGFNPRGRKVEKKGRTKEELHQVIEWLTGFDDKKIQALIDEKVTFETFFDKAKLHPNAHLITGVICGYRIEEIDNTLTQKVRYLDKLVDELAKGRKMEKILRQTD